MADYQTQKNMILSHLSAGYTLTPISALELFNCFSLAQRISNLLAEGHTEIQKRWHKTLSGKKVREYYIPKDGKAAV